LASRRRPAPPYPGCVPSANPLPAPAGDDAIAERRLVETLMPLVRLLAKQVAIELAGGGADAGDEA
jgi:hypothetical protein